MSDLNDHVITTTNLSFSFDGHTEILNNVSLQVPRGSLYGFLGPNGAGKTTTIRLLVGLLNDSGTAVRLFGQRLSEHRVGIFSKTGALIEEPSLYEHISGYDNLDIVRRVRGVEKRQVTELLHMLGLSDSASQKVREYSLGMKQRLGLAIALIGKPELLILDEPANGLDPGGIALIRGVLKMVNREFGTTIFLSSHLLSEIERMVTHIGIISDGELVFQGTIDALHAFTSNRSSLRIETDNNLLAAQLLGTQHGIPATGDRLVFPYESKTQVAQIVRTLIRNNINVYEATVERGNLEELFFRVTKNSQANSPASMYPPTRYENSGRTTP